MLGSGIVSPPFIQLLLVYTATVLLLVQPADGLLWLPPPFHHHAPEFNIGCSVFLNDNYYLKGNFSVYYPSHAPFAQEQQVRGCQGEGASGGREACRCRFIGMRTPFHSSLKSLSSCLVLCGCVQRGFSCLVCFCLSGLEECVPYIITVTNFNIMDEQYCIFGYLPHYL